MIELLVTGTGRCGTGYTAQLLTASGIPCGHEEVFTPRGVYDRADLEADASWCAVPFLEEFEGRIVHLVRHPMAVIRSFVGIRFFTHELETPHRRFASRHFRRTGRPMLDAMTWWLELNRLIERHADVRIRVEDLPAALPDLIGRPITPGPEPSRKTNHRVRGHVEELPEGTLTNEIREMALRYGYYVEVPS